MKDLTPTQNIVLDAYLKNGGNIRATARELKRDPKTIREHLQKIEHKLGSLKPVAKGDIEYSEPKALGNRRGGRVFILTCVQNNTHLHEGFFQNLLALREHLSAELHIAKVLYNHHAYLREGDGDIWYDPKISPFVSSKNLEIAPNLVWNGEVNILPTATNPLSGLDVFNGPKSGIFPHVKRGMVSVAMPRHEDAKFNYTSGRVTQRFYVPRKAGQKASFHHIYGALLVEVNSKGEWWVRQIEASDDGSFQDINVSVSKGKIKENSPISACIWGDIHVAQIDERIRRTVWGDGGIIDQLNPEVQVFHDLLDFRARNHHDRGNPHLNFRKYLDGADDVREEIAKTAEFLVEAWRPSTTSVVVPSNHDDALTRWLKETDYRDDPKNALFFLETQTAVYRAIAEGKDKDFHVLGWALNNFASDPVSSHKALSEACFLHIDDSYVYNNVELGNHGHLGKNGSRGSPRQFARIGLRSVTGHTHSAGIIEGNTCVGTFSDLNPEYSKGPSSWSHHFAVMYPNGKVSLINIKNGKNWRRS